MIVHCNQNIKDIYYNNHHIQHIYGCDGHLVYSGGTTPPTPPTPSYSGTYLTFRVLEYSGQRFKFSSDVQYSLNSGSTWTTLSRNTNTEPLNSGDTIMWKAEIHPTSMGIGTFQATGSIRWEVLGNPLSMILGDNFEGVTDISPYPYAFNNLFSNCYYLVSAKNLSLPATILGEACYINMFANCARLEEIPDVLPAENLVKNCYAYMFDNCDSLTTIPSGLLPSTTLAEGCYSYMFYNCDNISSAPILSATTLADVCYYAMFRGCTSLATAPTLPATTLVSRCYAQMFTSCTNLKNITCLATDISAYNCTNKWVEGVAPTGTFTTPSSTNWTSGDDGIQIDWTRQNI